MPPIPQALVRWLVARRARKVLPPRTGKIRIPDLSAPVQINWYRCGVPHVQAENLDDLFIAQGWLHASDRLWQMELHRRTSAGRLSEWFGPVALETDRATRILG